MPTDRTATVNAYFEAFGARDIDKLVSFFTPDATWIVPGDRSLTPWGGERRGPVEIREFFELFFEAAEPLAFEVYSFTEVGNDQVLINGRFAYRFHKSGVEYEDEFVQRYTVSDDKITAFRIFEDSLGLARAYLGQPVIAGGA